MRKRTNYYGQSSDFKKRREDIQNAVNNPLEFCPPPRVKNYDTKDKFTKLEKR